MARKIEVQRKSFGRIPDSTEMPNLLDVQLGSYNEFLQRHTPAEERKSRGLQQIFEEVFPVSDVNEMFSLEFVRYRLGQPRYSIRECRERNMTFASPLQVTMRLISREGEGKEKTVKDVIEQDVYLGELPLITEYGTFIINGAERVVVSQLHRSPGVFFDDDIHPNGKRLFNARIIPYRGSWVEFTTDINDMMYVHIDSRRKLPVTIFLRALGISTDDDLINEFYKTDTVTLTAKERERIDGLPAAESLVNEETGEVIIAVGDILDEDTFERLEAHKIKKLRIITKDQGREVFVILNTLKKDPTKSREEALEKIYSLLRPGEPPTIEMAEALLEKLFFNSKRYDLGSVGRYMINQRLGLKIDQETVVLTKEDFLAIIKYLIGLRNDQGFIDDIDHLGNRRCRTVGELMANLFSVGLSRIARTIRERLSLKDNEGVTPQLLINARTVSAVLDTFFGSSQLSQFMDQTNPLSELTHKRRVSALGPGGLTRERAGFEVRDVHHTHYGRVCPIETPEGPNIGLIMSLATFARINEFGFIETPYRKVVNGQVTDEIQFLSADEEDRHIIAQASEPLDDKNRFTNKVVFGRQRSDYKLSPPEDI
ncbi:MAG TPA: DNA-directed RNA polymerase subunit beta, partial [candidate division Zixibacteria bacterium]|nr:DNA-directed RNA polymerase subunit beta [candidate division Zixibacteria bacterium]